MNVWTDEYKAILNAIPEYLRYSEAYLVAVADAEGQYLYANVTFLRYFGNEQGGLDGLNLLGCVHQQDAPKGQQALTDALQHAPKPQTVRLRVKTHKGIYYHTQWDISTLLLSPSAPVGFLCIGHILSVSARGISQARQIVRAIDTMIDHVTDGFYILDKEWRFVKANALTAKMMGKSREELIGRSFWDFFDQGYDLYYQFPHEIRRAMTEGTPVQFEEFYPASGRWIWTALYPSEEGLTAFFRDITARKELEIELKDTQQRLLGLMNAIDDGFFILNQDWQFVLVNRAFERIIKTTKEEVYGRSIWEKYPHLVGTFFYNKLHKAVKTHTERHFSLYYERLDKYLEFHVYPNEEGLMVYFHDISEMVKSQAQLIDSEEKLRATYNSTNELMMFVDTDLRLRYYNRIADKYCTAVFGKPFVAGEDIRQYILPQEQAYFLSRMKAALSGEVVRSERRIDWASKIYWMQDNFYPVYNAHKHIIGIAINVVNITERKQYEQQLITKNHQLQNIAEIQSHKVRGPLATIMGLLNLLEEKGIEPHQSRYFEYLRQSAMRLDEIIHEVMAQADALREQRESSPDTNISP